MEKNVAGKREAEVEGLDQRMRLEWVDDSAFRFFPTQPDELFGYVLHSVDLATNKTSAAADRRDPRDIVDLVTIHETILPLGAAICAAVGRFPSQSPEEMLADIRRHSRFTAEEFRVLATEWPIDVPHPHRRMRGMIEDAGRFISRIPSDAVGVVFLERGNAVQPDLAALEKYQRHTGAPGGVWPSSSEISRSMLERYKAQHWQRQRAEAVAPRTGKLTPERMTLRSAPRPCRSVAPVGQNGRTSTDARQATAASRPHAGASFRSAASNTGVEYLTRGLQPQRPRAAFRLQAAGQNPDTSCHHLFVERVYFAIHRFVL
jgi:hypothetical protein